MSDVPDTDELDRLWLTFDMVRQDYLQKLEDYQQKRLAKFPLKVSDTLKTESHVMIVESLRPSEYGNVMVRSRQRLQNNKGWTKLAVTHLDRVHTPPRPAYHSEGHDSDFGPFWSAEQEAALRAKHRLVDVRQQLPEALRDQADSYERHKAATE